MGFFKPASGATASSAVARLQALIWTLIYAGLLTLVLGLAVGRSDDALGWYLVLLGCAVAAIGVLLIWVRSRIDQP